ncbi:MAG: DUF4352 domain-containing protein [Nannocystaceae bacterium]|nr:DUF4352 domain-containing protein [Nannocystaceae bacterium]
MQSVYGVALCLVACVACDLFDVDGGSKGGASAAGKVGASAAGKVGDTLRVENFDVLIHATEDPYVPAEGKAKTAHRMLAFDVELQHAGGDENLKYSGGKWHLYDTEGHAFEAIVLDNRTKEPRLTEGFVTPGNKARGWVTFEVPTAAGLDRVEFFTGYVSGHTASFKL